MSVFLIFVFIFVYLFPFLSVGNDYCMPTRCVKYGPIIQFPFRIRSLQPKHCGYQPGFDLYCDDKTDDTVLVLPYSIKVAVTEINYLNQTIEVRLLTHAPECLPERLVHFNFSVLPFKSPEYALEDITLFNCSAWKGGATYTSIICSRNFSYLILAFPSSAFIESLALTSCTKLQEILSFPYDFYTYSFTYLSWDVQMCADCESQGKLCGFKNYTKDHQLHCRNKNVATPGESDTPLIAGTTLGCILFVVIVASLCLLYISFTANKEYQVKIQSFLENYRALKPTRFSYADIRKITNEFREKLGEGGYGIVYKGNMSNEIYVAVKVLNHSEGNGEDFINEVATIGRIHHVNVVRLVGYCADGSRRALVYEFLPNDSLEKFIFQVGPKRNFLSKEKLQDIALGVAKGIEYLHQGCDQQILHFDIKPHNILLDQNFNPKICDFGLAKLCAKEQSAVSMTAARGTMGYIAPEVLSRTFGRASYKSDVYSFGMMLLEMVGGRKNEDLTANASKVYYPKWIYNHLNQEEISVQIDENDESKITRKLTIVGLSCIQWSPSARPSMKEVLQMLEGDGNELIMPPNPFPDTNAKIPAARYQTELELISEAE